MYSKVLENRSTFEMYLSTSTSTDDFPQMYLSTFQVLYKLYLSTDVLKYKVLLPGSGPDMTCPEVTVFQNVRRATDQWRLVADSDEHVGRESIFPLQSFKCQ